MSRAAIIVIADRVVSAGAQLDDHFLEFADDQHVFKDRDRFGGVYRAGLQLALKIALIAVCGDLAAIDHERIEPRPHVAQICAGFDRHLVALSWLQARATGTRDPPVLCDSRYQGNMPDLLLYINSLSWRFVHFFHNPDLRTWTPFCGATADRAAARRVARMTRKTRRWSWLGASTMLRPTPQGEEQ
jgi:hypothetical protein